MKRRKYSIIIIPPEHSKPPRQIQFSKQLLLVGSITLGLILAGIIGHDIYQTRYIASYNQKIAYVDSLETEIQAKKLEIDRLNEKAAEINEDLRAIFSLEQKIARLLKINPESSEISRGNSPFRSAPTAQNLDQAASLVDNHRELLETYHHKIVEYEKKLRATPDIYPVHGEITSRFGYRNNPFGRRAKEFHNGIDIACSYGTSVKAAADGTVIFSGWDGSWGRKIEIDHGYGIVTFYAHNSSLLVQVGDKVSKGQVIAKSGNSGRSTGSHLHYSIFVNGQPVNPLRFLSLNKER
ncbi:MAG: peptidoglycan DD-metalloendopeptidase family protein [Desulfitobacteriia bacterium]